MHSDPGFGLYVHWPFCQSKCPYCDFNSHVVSNVDQVLWRNALISEINRSAKEVDKRVLSTIYFGGGTPSLMSPDTVAGVIEAARAAWSPSNSLEITLEANPSSVEAGRFQAYADAGVNRVSIGVQALRDDDLRALGRLHDADEARAAVTLGKRTFRRVSFDLIYGRQGQSLADWKAELGEALSLGADHLSLYQLTVEEGTAFGDRFRAGKLRGLPDEDASADLFDVTQELTDKAGFPAYEVSNHAAPDEQSRHNLIYWSSGDWIGVGPGAHGRFWNHRGRAATETHMSPSAWIQAVERSGSGISQSEVLSDAEVIEERLLMGLRLHSGVQVMELPDNLQFNIKRLMSEGLLEQRADYVCSTPAGRPLLNHILKEIFA